MLQQLQVIIVLMEFETLFFLGGLFDSMKYNIIYHVLKKQGKKSNKENKTNQEY